VDPDVIIERYIVCESHECCYILRLHDIDSPAASVPHHNATGAVCPGALFKTDDKGKRRPLKVMPFTPLSKTLRLFMRDPNYVEKTQQWRVGFPDDQVGNYPPETGMPDKHSPLSSVHDGMLWRSRAVNRRRHVSDYAVSETVDGPVEQRLVLLKYGLLASINLDWYECLAQVDLTHPGSKFTTSSTVPSGACTSPS
jgi:hypothetical protein